MRDETDAGREARARPEEPPAKNADDRSACECVVQGHHDPDDAECLSIWKHSNGRLLCSRPDGHDGPHAACNRYEHPVMVWTDDMADGQVDQGDGVSTDGGVPTVDPLLIDHDIPCGASIPHEDGDDVEPLCVDGSACAFPASYVVTRDGDEMAVCGCHLPDAEESRREPAVADGGDEMPGDPFDRSPEDYDVSDHPAAQDSQNGG